MANPIEDILLSVLSAEEKKRIPEDIASKLSTAFSDKLHSVLSEKGVLKTAKDKSERNFKECNQKYISLQASYDAQTEQLKTLTEGHTNLETQLRANTDELASVWQQCTQYETESAKLRQERESAVEERDSARVELKQTTADLSKVIEEVKQLQLQLQRQTDSKYEAQAQLGDVESRMAQLENKEKQIELDRAAFKTQIDSLEHQLTDRTNELLTIRRDSSGYSVLLETKHATLQSEHLSLQQQHTALHHEHAQLQTNATRAQTDAAEALATSQQRLDAAQLQLDAQRKLIELLQSDADVRNKQIEDLQLELDIVVKKLAKVEEEVKNDELKHVQLIDKKSECIQLLHKELQTQSQLQTKTSSIAIDNIFPHAAKMSNLLNNEAVASSMTLTEIYNVYVEASMLLIEERDETKRLRGYIQQLTGELQEKTSLLQGAMETFGQLTREMEQMREQLQEHAECASLKEQLRDLGRQVCKLLINSDVAAQDLVTFDNVVELQQNNQRLLAAVRDLTNKLRVSTDDTQQLKQLSEANAELIEQKQRQDGLITMITVQRDRYKTLCNHQMEQLSKSKPVAADSQLKEQLTQLTTEHDTYRKDKSANDQIIIDTSERLRLDHQQLSAKYALQSAALDTTQRHLASAKRSLDSLRGQVDALEDRLQIHASAQVKLEDSVMQHKDTLYETMTKLSRSEVALGQAQKDLLLLKGSNERLSKERETFRAECQSLKLLQGNLSVFKATMERTDAENRLSLEATLNKQQKLCAELQLKLTEEQRNVKVLSEDLRAKIEVTKKSVEEERLVSEKLRSELKTKTQQLVSVAQQSNSSALLHSRQLELEAVKQNLESAKVALKQHSDNAEQSSKQLNALSETYAKYRSDTEAKINKLQTESSENVEQRLAKVLEQLTTQEVELIKFKKIAEEMSDKYEREVKLHSDDLLSLTSFKTTIEALRKELKHLQAEHSNLLKSTSLKEDFAKEKQALEQKYEELNAQNKQLQEELLNTSAVEEVSSNDSSSALVKNIQHIKRKMDVALSKLDVVNTENAGLKLELNLARKELTDAQKVLVEERRKNETPKASSAAINTEETNVETMNALTDSNRILRTERDAQLDQIKDLQLKVTKLQNDVEQLSGTKQRCDSLQSENTTLRGEATRWRQRANTLIEKTNRTSTEDWKKLQTERETLAKQLTMERSNIVRLTDELTTHQTELETVKATNTQLTTDHEALNKDVETKAAQLLELRAAVAQLRRIAKKYKDQVENWQEAAAPPAADEISKLQSELRAQTEASEATIAQLTARNEESAKEVEKAKEMMQVNKDRFTQVLKQVKDRMAGLTEQKLRLEKELNEIKGVAGTSSDNISSETSSEEQERHKSEVDELKARLSQLQRLLEDNSTSGQSTSDNVATTAPPTANIKPMAGHMASIRPLHPLQQLRSTVGVPQVSVQPQQVHTTAVASTSTSSATTIDSLPSSSHSLSEQSQLPTIRVLPSVVDTSSTTTLAVVGVVSAVTAASSSGSTAVTTSGTKRMRSAADGAESSDTSKRIRLSLEQQQQQEEEAVVEEVQQQVVDDQLPTSSQRDHDEVQEEEEDDTHVIHLAVSDDEGDDAEAIAAEDNADDTEDGVGRQRKRARIDEVCDMVEAQVAEEDNAEVEAEQPDDASTDQQQMEATSSSTTATSSSEASARPQQQQLLVLPEESADDGIVPSTPTLVVPRRSGTAGEGVSSPHPHVPTVGQGRLFTFSIDRAAVGEQEVQQGNSNDGSDANEAGNNNADSDQASERNVPSTVQPGAEEEVEEGEGEEESDSSAQAQQQQQVEGSEEANVAGPSTGSATEDEGREAEATPVGGSVTGIPRAIPTISGQRRPAATTARPVSSSGAPTPISWGQQMGHMGPGPGRASPRHPGRGLGLQRMRRNRGAMPPRGGYSRY